MQEIDYENVNEKNVEQAYESGFRLTEEQLRKLIQSKFERAESHYHALKASPLWNSDV